MKKTSTACTAFNSGGTAFNAERVAFNAGGVAFNAGGLTSRVCVRLITGVPDRVCLGIVRLISRAQAFENENQLLINK